MHDFSKCLFGRVGNDQEILMKDAVGFQVFVESESGGDSGVVDLEDQGGKEEVAERVLSFEVAEEGGDVGGPFVGDVVAEEGEEVGEFAASLAGFEDRFGVEGPDEFGGAKGEGVEEGGVVRGERAGGDDLEVGEEAEGVAFLEVGRGGVGVGESEKPRAEVG